MADVDPTLGQEILDLSQRQWVPRVRHYDKRITSGEPLKYRNGLRMAHALPRSEAARRNCCDTTMERFKIQALEP
jgi:hypothetical protein